MSWLIWASLLVSSDVLARPERLVLRTSKEIQATTQQLMGEARRGTRHTVIIDVKSTFDFGCDCPPFVYARDGEQTEGNYPERFLFSKTSTAAADPAKYQVPGIFRLTGYFSGRMLNRVDWHKERGEPSQPPADGREYWLEPHPEFVVDRWCFLPPSGRHRKDYDPESRAEIAVSIRQMKKVGVPLCR